MVLLLHVGRHSFSGSISRCNHIYALLAYTLHASTNPAYLFQPDQQSADVITLCFPTCPTTALCRRPCLNAQERQARRFT
jgi:hypothetical protein